MEISTGLGIVIFGLLYCARSIYEVYGHTKLQKMRIMNEQLLTTRRLDSDEKQAKEMRRSEEKIAETAAKIGKDFRMTATVENKQYKDVVREKAKDREKRTGKHS